MQVIINNEKKTIPESITITELLKNENVKMPQMVSVELNGQILNRDTFDNTIVAENDEINFLYFMGGGK